jgi:hypothetical protein
MIRWLISLIDRKRREAQTARYMAEIRAHRKPSVQSYIEPDTRQSIDEYRRDPKAWKEKHQ